MASRKWGWGGFELTVSANSTGAAMSFGFEGALWQRAMSRLAGAAVPGTVTAHAVPAPVKERTPASEVEALRQRVQAITWYHTLDLGHGIVTPGQFDHRPLLPRYRLPNSLAGLRVMDVATFDGFWAFEMERRGAAEVVAIDLDRPAELDFPPAVLAAASPEELELRFGQGFAIAKDALRSKVERVTCSVYDLSPQTRGLFDVVHAGDLLIHLNSPVKALQRIASVTRGCAFISDVYSPGLDRAGAGPLMEYRGGQHDVTWWRFGLKAIRQMVLDAGFRHVEQLATFRYGTRAAPNSIHHVVFKAIK